MLSEWNKEIDALVKITKQAIPMTLNAQRNINQAEFKHKTDGSIVSIYDYAIQVIVMHYINKLLPDDDVLGEEEMSKVSDDFLNGVIKILPSNIDPIETCSRSIRQISPNNRRTWVINPIDGTEGFVQHDAYAIATCLLVDLCPKVSITAWPLHNKKYTGINMEGPLIFIAIKGDKSYVMDLNNNIEILSYIKIPEKVHLTNNIIGYRQKYTAV